MPTAQEGGWGNPDTPDFRKNNIVEVKAGGIVVYVNKKLAFIVKYLLDETVRRGYKLAGGQPDDWSYANRCVRGTGPGTKRPCVKSNHSWGRALDLNALANPMTSDNQVHTNIPDWMVNLWAAWGFKWGGGYSGSRKDPMHFEFLATIKDAARLTDALKRKLAYDKSKVRKPAPKRNPYKPQAETAVVGYGAHGDHVRFIQWALRLQTDGDFGPATVAEVKRFQNHLHTYVDKTVKVDGKVGSVTLGYLKKITR